MVKHKDEEFSEYKKIIQDFELKKIPGDKFDLSVATIPLAD